MVDTDRGLTRHRRSMAPVPRKAPATTAAGAAAASALDGIPAPLDLNLGAAQFASVNGNFTLDSTGDITLISSTLSATHGKAALYALGDITVGGTQKEQAKVTQSRSSTGDGKIVDTQVCSGQGTSDYSCSTQAWTRVVARPLAHVRADPQQEASGAIR